MKTYRRQLSTLSIAFLVSLAAVPSYVLFAAEKQVTGTNIRGPLLSRTTYPSNMPNGKVVLTIRRNSTRSDNPDWDGTEGVFYNLAIQTGGSGTDVGYVVRTHKNGDMSYSTYSGTTNVVSKPDKTWEATWKGSWESVGGTGRYAKLKGGGTYSGKANSNEHFGTDWEGKIDY